MQTFVSDLPSEILVLIALYLRTSNPRFHTFLNFALSCRNVHEAVAHILYHSLKVDYLRKPLVKPSSNFSARIISHTRRFAATTTSEMILNSTFPRLHQLEELELRFSHPSNWRIASKKSKFQIENLVSSFTFDTLRTLALSIEFFEDFWPTAVGDALSRLKLLRTFNLKIHEFLLKQDDISTSLAALSLGISHLVDLCSFTLMVVSWDANISIAPILDGLKFCRNLKTLSLELYDSCFDSIEPLKPLLSMGFIENVRLSHVSVDVNLIRIISCSSISTIILESVYLDLESIVLLFKSPRKVLRLSLDFIDLVNSSLPAITLAPIEELSVEIPDDDTFSERILQQLIESTHLRILTIDVWTEKGMIYLSEIIQNSSSLMNLTCRFRFEKLDNFVFETLFTSIHSNQFLSSINVLFETIVDTPISSFVNIGPNVKSLAIAFDICDEFSLYLFISKLRENPICKLEELNISIPAPWVTKREVLRIKLDPGSKCLAFGLVSYWSDFDRTLVVNVFRDCGNWKDTFEVDGIFMEDLSEDEELSLLRDLRDSLNRDFEVKFHNGRILVCFDADVSV